MLPRPAVGNTTVENRLPIIIVLPNSSVVAEIPKTAASLAFPLLSFHNVGVWILYESAEYLENNPGIRGNVGFLLGDLEGTVVGCDGAMDGAAVGFDGAAEGVTVGFDGAVEGAVVGFDGA